MEIPKNRNLLIFTLVIIALACSNEALASPGAIFSTDVGCVGVNINIYDSKADVYLNGGPNGGGPGLPEGDYYVQVTEPNGTVLGKSVSAAAHVNADGKFAQCYQLTAILFTNSSGFTAGGYDTTTNNGNEYKVWASKDPTFANSNSKTDNFKVKPEDCVDCQLPPVSITGSKFYDYNENGVFDPNEQSIPGWKMTLYKDNVEVGMTETDSDGFYEFLVDVNTGDYVVKEELRSSENWEAITDAEMTVDSNTNHTGIDFGNIRNARLSGFKFKDVNMNGVQDLPGDIPISGINITITTVEPTGDPMNPVVETVPTDINGEWSSSLYPIGTTYQICENVNTNVYLQTAPASGCYTGTLAFSIDDQGNANPDDDVTLFFAPVDVGGFGFGNIPLFRIGGIKFYDADLSGTFTGGDTRLAGIKITVTVTKPNGASDGEMTLTGVNGVWTSKLYPEGTTYTVTETLPLGNWTQLANRGTSGTVNGSNDSADFLNVCSLTPGGRTLGFWSNKNGQALITAGDFTRLNGYNLRNANGTDRDFNESTLDNKKKALNSWILSANASNMAYMLSAQMTATDLSIAKGFTVPTVYVDGTRTVAQEIAYANNLLTNGLTVSSGAARTEQGRVKDIFDKINNGGSFKQSVPCSVVYP